MSKVLFLDIDGVLNSDFWNDSHQTEIRDGTLIDEEKIKLLACLVKETNSEKILLWLNLHNNVTEWVVLDDLDLHSDRVRPHQVKINQTTGLTPENVKQAPDRIINSCFPFSGMCMVRKAKKGIGKYWQV